MKRRRRRATVDNGRDIGVVGGAVAALVGVALISIAAALIIGGVALAAGCILIEGQR